MSPGKLEAIVQNLQKAGDESHADPALQQLPDSPRLSRRVIWAEVLAVLAIGVFPHLNNALFWFKQRLDGQPPNALPFWLESLWRTIQSSCIIAAVLFVMFRSRERFAYFGLKRPRWIDVLLGLGILVCANFVWPCVYQVFSTLHFREEIGRPERHAVDYILLVATCSSNAFSEELVTRTYLITRFQFLLRSKLRAVVFAAMLFASYHIYGGIAHSAYTFVLGILMGAVFLATRRIWAAFIGHFLLDIQAHLT